MKRYQMLIGGEWLDAEGGATFESGEPIPAARGADTAGRRPMSTARSRLRSALFVPEWRRLSASARGALLRRLATSWRAKPTGWPSSRRATTAS